MASAAQPTIVASVRDLLGLHGSWDQVIKVTMPGRGGVTFTLDKDRILPVALYEYEVVACVRDATEESGLKWWLRTFVRSCASKRRVKYSWGSIFFVCPHSREAYKKQAKDNSRDSRHKSCLGCECKLVLSGEIVRCLHPIMVCSSNNFQVSDVERTALIATASSWQGIQIVFSVQTEISVQLSDTRRVYFFSSYSDAEVASRQVPNGVKCDLQRKAIWTVTDVALRHVPGHYPAVLAHEKNMIMTFELTQEARALRANGAPLSTIINHLTAQGAKGLVTKNRMQAITRLLDQDLCNFTYQPTATETQMSALLRMLSEREKRLRDIKFIYLFSYATEADLDKIKDGCEDQVVFPNVGVVDSSNECTVLDSVTAKDLKAPTGIMASLVNFFRDKASSLVLKAASPAGKPLHVVPAPKTGKPKWMPSQRMITANGRLALLLAIIWCTVPEIELFKKYPEVVGHDTKAAVSEVPAPWWYSIGIRENKHTFVVMRGIIANETLAMFRFVLCVAFPFLHGRMLDAVCAQLSDGKDEALRVLASMMASGGLTPHSKQLRCAWHIIDRAIWRIFGTLSRDWQFALVRIFWIWQQQETHEAISAIREWIKTDFFTSKYVQDDMSGKDKNLFIDFIETLYETRLYWARSHNLEVRCFDARVNTFVESNNSVLTERVGVNAGMTITTVVRKEDMWHSQRGKKHAHAAHHARNRMYSHVNATDLDNAFQEAEQHMCQVPLKYLKEQVAVAAACLSCERTKSHRCPHTDEDHCALCTKYLTSTQKRDLTLGSCIVIHMRCYLPEPSTKVVKFDSLPTPFANLLKSMPRFKHWRVVTCREVSTGRWKVLCSCGYGQRHMMACLHCSFFIQKVTRQQMYGCDIDNIHIRHTNLYASVKDTSHVHRTHDDWKGVHFEATADAIFTAFPLPSEEEDTNDNDHSDGDLDTGGHDHGTRARGRQQQAASEELLKRKERMGKLRSQMFEILNVLDTIPPEDFNETHAPAVETAVLAIRQSLPMFPMRTVTTIAKRPSGQRPKGGGASRKRAAATDTGTSLPLPSTTSVIVINSNSEHEEAPPAPPERNIRWNAYTREMEYRSSEPSSSDESDGEYESVGSMQM